VRVQVRLLGTYRRYLPASAHGATYSMDVPIGTRIESLLTCLPVPPDDDRVILVNGRSPQWGQVLEEGDTVAAFPAMAGG
jgi:molybdopterin converting factor small subunit